MPAFLAPIIIAIADAVGLTITIATATAIAEGAILLGGMALSAYQQQRAKQQAKDAYNAAQVDRMANVVTTVGQRDLVLGRVRKGGAVYFRGSVGQYKEVFYVAIAIAAHEIDAVEQVYFNDVAVTLDGSGYVQDAPYQANNLVSAAGSIGLGGTTFVLPSGFVAGSVSCVVPDDGASYLPVTFTLAGSTVTLDAPAPNTVTVNYQVSTGTSYARVWWTTGAPGQTADATLLANFPTLWSAAARAQGVATLFCEFHYNETAFPSGLPAVTVQLRGAKVYDPRSGLTAWSQNPALLARHVYQHPSFGKAVVSAAEDARFTVAANACDVSYDYIVSGFTSPKPLFRASMVAQFGADARSLLDDLTQAMAGMWAFAGGELYIRAGVYTASVMSLTDADLAVIQSTGDSTRQEQMSIAVHRERAQKFNVVNLRIWDGDQAYKQVALSPVKGTALIARDGSELAQEVTLSAVTYSPQAQHIGGVMMRDARDPLTFDACWKLKAYPLEMFDTVDITLSRYGWVAKTFIVLSYVWDRNLGVIKLTLKETNAAIYTPDASFLPQGYAANTSLPSPYTITPPTLDPSTVYSGTSELRYVGGSVIDTVRVVWAAVPDLSVSGGGFIDLQWTPVSDITQWAGITVSGDSTQAVLVGMADSQVILIRARCRSNLAASAWSTQITHTVIGKTEPPPAVTGVALSSDTVFFTELSRTAVPDLAGYLVRVLAGSTAEWSLGTPLQQGVVTASPWLLPITLYGINTIMVAAIDTSGNVGAAGSATQDFGAAITTNAIQQYDFAANAWLPGFVTNGAFGATVAGSTDPAIDFWAMASDFWVRDGAADYWGGTTYLQMQYIGRFYPAYGGGNVTLALTATGSRVTIESRIDGSTSGDWWLGAAGAGSADIWSGGTTFWSDPGAWATWLGSAVSVGNRGIEWRITISAGPIQPVISAMVASMVLPLVNQVFGQTPVLAAGTRLAPVSGVPSRNWITVTAVHAMPFNDGGGAITARVDDFNAASGPLIELLNSAGAAVNGTATAVVYGYEDALS